MNKIFTVFNFEFRSKLKSTLLWCTVMFSIMCLYLGMFPYIKDIALAKFDAMPQELLAAVGMSQEMNFTEYNLYLAMIYNIFAIVLSANAALKGCAIIHEEEELGTIEFLNAANISRSEYFAAKSVFLALQFLLITISCGLAAAIFGFINKNINIRAIISIFAFTYIVQLLFNSLGLLFGSFLKKNIKAGNLALATVFGSYLLGYISNIGPKSIGFLKYFSPLDFLSCNMIMQSTIGVGTDKPDILGIILGPSLILIFYIAAFFIYRKKDLT